MKTPRSLLPLLLVAATFALSCGDDSTTPKTSAASGFQDLSQKGHVLNNFELANNKRDISHYDALLDDNFTFFYLESDVGGGGTPVQWGRDTDIAATHVMFASLDKLDFNLDNENLVWNETPAPGGLENWYVTTVFYHFTMHMGNTTYIPNAGAKMSLTVRNAGTDVAPSWRLVELHDLGGPSLLRSTHAAGTEPTTYGQVKALFRK